MPPDLFLNIVHLVFARIAFESTGEMFCAISFSVIASLIVWLLFNILLTPKLEITGVQFDKNHNPYIRISNKSYLFRAYEVYCHISYHVAGKLVFRRTATIMPVLRCANNKSGCHFRVKLAQSKSTNDIFSNENIMLRVVVTAQNKFGVKRIFSRKIILEDD